MINKKALMKKLDARHVRSLADADRRQSPASYQPNGVTVTLSEEECQHLRAMLAASENLKQ